MRAHLAIALAVAGCGGGGGGTHADAPPGGAHDGGGVDAAPQPLEQIHFVGRFTDEANPRFEWPGTAIATHFTGTTISVRLDDGGNNRFTVTVDGVAQAQPLVPQAGAHDYVLAQGLAAGAHDVAIARRTESFFGATTFLGFSGATLVATPRPGRWIEMIGDSITCGYGVLGPGPQSCFSDDTEDETRAWGALAAAQLGAAHTAIAYSGKGVIRNGDGTTTDLVPALFARVLADDAAATGSDPVPDVVVVDLGTNDFATGDPGQAFADGYATFLAAIRARYPQAWIIVASSPMLSDGYPQGAMQRTKAAGYLQAAIAARAGAGDARVSFLDVAEQDGNADGYACDYHPSLATHQKMAATLVGKIKALTGW